ncbi:hypothetical protein TGVAND_436600 [Toxoplasma gondii VAND]|uniref:Uncharacterized protein n=1 Tax=Toxoplasma gondii VAND TaxID=933077 RepID=A0A086Q3K8_TOXGO|nr:hypothetical protein TGVAND_436600 [Toxoplasma gondii VAND]
MQRQQCNADGTAGIQPRERSTHKRKTLQRPSLCPYGSEESRNRDLERNRHLQASRFMSTVATTYTDDLLLHRSADGDEELNRLMKREIEEDRLQDTERGNAAPGTGAFVRRCRFWSPSEEVAGS